MDNACSMIQEGYFSLVKADLMYSISEDKKISSQIRRALRKNDMRAPFLVGSEWAEK